MLTKITKNFLILIIFGTTTYGLWRLIDTLYFKDVGVTLSVLSLFFGLITYSNVVAGLTVYFWKTNLRKNG